MPRTEIDFIQARDSEYASQLELDQVKDNNASPTEFVASTMNNYALYLKNQQSGYASLGQLLFGSDIVPYFRNNTDTWDVAGRFFFPGISQVGTPNGFKFIGELRSGNGECRLYDVNNNNQIGLVAYSASSWTVFTTTSLSNIPTNESIWEVQIRESPTLPGNQARISCFQLIF